MGREKIICQPYASRVREKIICQPYAMWRLRLHYFCVKFIKKMMLNACVIKYFVTFALEKFARMNLK